MVFEIFDDSVDREPIDVHVKDIHEYGYLYTLFFQVLRFVCFLYNHDFPVGRGEDSDIVRRDVPVRETEKVYHQEVADSTDNEHLINSE